MTPVGLRPSPAVGLHPARYALYDGCQVPHLAAPAGRSATGRNAGWNNTFTCLATSPLPGITPMKEGLQP
jgi:hypothetical protein